MPMISPSALALPQLVIEAMHTISLKVSQCFKPWLDIIWHKDQNAVASCLLQLLSEDDGLNDALLTFVASHQPCWRCVDKV